MFCPTHLVLCPRLIGVFGTNATRAAICTKSRYLTHPTTRTDQTTRLTRLPLQSRSYLITDLVGNCPSTTQPSPSNMADQMTGPERVALIKDQLHEVLKPEIIEDIVVKQNRPLVVYWGINWPRPAPPPQARTADQSLTEPS